MDKEKGRHMRRMTMAIAVAVVSLLLTAGMALAAMINGTDGPDTLKGTNSADTMRGYGGQDTMYGRIGSDNMYGGSQRDTIYGDYGDDKIYGNGGNDVIHGGSDGDRIFGGSGKDVIDGELGSDYINVADGQFDSVSCGVGTNDRAVVDETDLSGQSFEDFVRLSSCENVKVR